MLLSLNIIPMNQQQDIYQLIIKSCNKLSIAKYLKNEIKESIKYFHSYKLQNIHKNLSFLRKYLLHINNENCKQIDALEIKDIHKKINNKIQYFYNIRHFTESKQKEIQMKIETNSYKIITIMQWLRWLLLLTIDEICNATPTRMDINCLLLGETTKKEFQKHKKCSSIS